MRIEPVTIKAANKFVQEYRQNEERARSYFDFAPFGEEKRRLQDVKQRVFKRAPLVRILKEMNEAWGAPKETISQIERLKDDESVVVIGGQQAGLLTGPLYSIHKVISILTYAREQEKRLGVPVVPVFWIAGEDHDFAEINHIFIDRKGTLEKHTVAQQVYEKKPISFIKLDKRAVSEWVRTSFLHLPETEHTKVVFETINRCLHEAETYVDFFAKLIFALFPNDGVVLFDSAHENVRKIESDYFIKLIDAQENIASSVFETVEKMKRQGFAEPIEVERDDTHLFYYDGRERILLKRDGAKWVGKHDEVVFTTEEIKRIAREQPEKLSNNVVTRPIMQELLFPTLAFIGGDAEIHYWATLKNCFRAVDPSFTMPLIISRMSYTWVTDRVGKLLQQRAIDEAEVLGNPFATFKTNWLLSSTSPPIDRLFQEVKENIAMLHEPIRQMARSISDDLYQQSERNLTYIEGALTDFERKMVQKVEEKHDVVLMQFQEIENTLKPFGGLQERIWNPLPFINEYGLKTFSTMCTNAPFISHEDHHHVVYFS